MTNNTHRGITQMTEVQNILGKSIADLNALGPMPTLPRKGVVHLRHPDANAWVARAETIGRDFLLSVWRGAKGGDSHCIGFINATLFPNDPAFDDHNVTDETVKAFADTITLGWTESLRAIPRAA